MNSNELFISHYPTFPLPYCIQYATQASNGFVTIHNVAAFSTQTLAEEYLTYRTVAKMLETTGLDPIRDYLNNSTQYNIAS